MAYHYEYFCRRRTNSKQIQVVWPEDPHNTSHSSCKKSPPMYQWLRQDNFPHAFIPIEFEVTGVYCQHRNQLQCNKGAVKLSLCLMETWEIKLYAFLDLALDRNKWSASCSGHLYPQARRACN